MCHWAIATLPDRAIRNHAQVFRAFSVFHLLAFAKDSGNELKLYILDSVLKVPMKTARRLPDINSRLGIEHKCDVKLNEVVIVLDGNALVVPVDPFTSHGSQDRRIDPV